MRRVSILAAILVALSACASSRVLVNRDVPIPDVHEDTQLDQVLADDSQASRDYCDHWGGRVVIHADGTVVCEDMDN